MKRLQTQSILKYIFSASVLVLQAACMRTIIVYKPPVQIDPLPITTKPALEEAKADPLVEEQWNLNKVGADGNVITSPDFAGNYNVKVAVLSTGIDYNHEDLIGQVAINKKEITQKGLGDRIGIDRLDNDYDGLVDNIVGYDVVDGDGLAYDRHGAGTAVAGIIAAKQNNGKGIAGLMRNVTLYPVRYINENGQSSVASLVAALDIAVKYKPDVVYIQTTQVQMGGDRHDSVVASVEMSLLEKPFKALHKLKIPVIVGAGDDLGNFGGDEVGRMLKRYENVVVVTAADKNDAIPLMANIDFDGVKTMAPGEDILTTQPLNKYGVVHGTAYAAAHVAAAFALAKSQFGDKLNYEDYNPVLISAKGSDIINGMDRFSRGGNRLNIPKFLAALKSR